ncbi:MAG: cytosine permease [Peptoniphilaceae bacterium]|nr:cytosine permease [Peptoniphilaceae bacterium]MDY6086173.1 cytosine permease [Peptoniphilaceae bacterium]
MDGENNAAVRGRSVEDTEFSLSAVSETKRQSIWALLMVLVGFTYFSPSMSAGGNLGLGLNARDFFIAMILGNAFLGIYTGVLAYIGQKTGLTLDLLAIHSFGSKGSYLSSALVSFTQIGWFGVGVAMFALPLSEITHIHPLLIVCITGLLMTMTAYYGFKALAILGTIAVPLITVLGIYSVSYGVNTVGGWAHVFSDNPSEPLTMAAALTLVIGNFISGGTSTPNFTRFGKTAFGAVFSTVVAFFIGNIIMFLFGAVGGATTGQADIFYILMAQGLTLPAILVLGLNIWTTNNNALYTAGLGLSNISKKPSSPLVLVGGAIGTVLAIWLYDNFTAYLTFLGGLIPPVGAVIIIHYFLHRAEYEHEGFVPEMVNLGAILAVVIGAAVGTLLPWGVAPVNALLTAAVIEGVWEMERNRHDH